MPAVVHEHLTPSRYLALDRGAEVRHEYVGGQVYAMRGASREHNHIVFNLAGLLYSNLRGRPCEAFVADMRVTARTHHSYFYPDLVAVCGQAAFEDEERDTLVNPLVIIEVLSPSTEGYDRGLRFAHYRTIPSLREYVLVAQDRHSIDRYLREGEDRWVLTEFAGKGSCAVLETVGVRLPLDAVYEGIDPGA